MFSECLLPDKADSPKAQEVQVPETTHSVTPRSADNISAPPSTTVSKPESSGWLSWLTGNFLYLGGAALALLMMLRWFFSKSAEKNAVRPRIKSGSFKKSNRFQESKDTGTASKPEGIASENVASDNSRDDSESSGMFDFEEAADSALLESDSSSISGGAMALAGGTAAIDDDDDFLDLMADDAEETDAEKLVDAPDELGGSSSQESLSLIHI